MTDRLQQIHDFITGVIGAREYDFAPASSDASFRRYFRISYDNCTKIVMDAPPERENCEAFITVAGFLADIGLNVPLIEASDLSRGLLLISDLGTVQYLDRLSADNVERLYDDAMRALLRLQQARPTIELPQYNRELLLRELGIFTEWYLQKHSNIQLNLNESEALQKCFEVLVENALEQPRVIVHRDYHSRNLLDTGTSDPGILDFQDAVIGPITYDLVSLLKDCYISWPVDKVEQWACHYKNRCIQSGILDETSDQQFLRWFDLMGTQRHLKAIGIFARLNHRDGKPGYLKDIPRTMAYVQRCVERYQELQPLSALIGETRTV